MTSASEVASSNLVFKYKFNPLNKELEMTDAIKAHIPMLNGVYTIEAGDNTLTLFTLKFHKGQGVESLSKNNWANHKYTIIDFNNPVISIESEKNLFSESLKLHTVYFCKPIKGSFNLQFKKLEGDGSRTDVSVKVPTKLIFNIEEAFNLIRKLYEDTVKQFGNNIKIIVISDLDETIGQDTPTKFDGSSLTVDSKLIESDYSERLTKLRKECPNMDFVIITNTSAINIPTKFANLGLDISSFNTVLGHQQEGNGKANPSKASRVEGLLKKTKYQHVIIIDDDIESLREQVRVAFEDINLDTSMVTPVRFVSGIPLKVAKEFETLNLKLEYRSGTGEKIDYETFLDMGKNREKIQMHQNLLRLYSCYGNAMIQDK